MPARHFVCFQEHKRKKKEEDEEEAGTKRERAGADDADQSEKTRERRKKTTRATLTLSLRHCWARREDLAGAFSPACEDEDAEEEEDDGGADWCLRNQSAPPQSSPAVVETGVGCLAPELKTWKKKKKQKDAEDEEEKEEEVTRSTAQRDVGVREEDRQVHVEEKN